jgi:hypothetical protein
MADLLGNPTPGPVCCRLSWSEFNHVEASAFDDDAIVAVPELPEAEPGAG